MVCFYSEKILAVKVYPSFTHSNFNFSEILTCLTEKLCPCVGSGYTT